MNAASDPAETDQSFKPPPENISPVEDLMREHGVLRRILLVYEEAAGRLDNHKAVPPEVILKAAEIIRIFIEEYHEKLEEQYLFPRFEKAGRFVQTVQTLREQHAAGRVLTGKIKKSVASPRWNDLQVQAEAAKLLRLFIRMYRPHAAWEDTELFPAFKLIVSRGEYDMLGDQFEAKEQELFGARGFETKVEEAGELEKAVGIHDLSQVTPRIK